MILLGVGKEQPDYHGTFATAVTDTGDNGTVHNHTGENRKGCHDNTTRHTNSTGTVTKNTSSVSWADVVKGVKKNARKEVNTAGIVSSAFYRNNPGNRVKV